MSKSLKIIKKSGLRHFGEHRPILEAKKSNGFFDFRHIDDVILTLCYHITYHFCSFCAVSVTHHCYSRGDLKLIDFFCARVITVNL